MFIWFRLPYILKVLSKSFKSRTIRTLNVSQFIKMKWKTFSKIYPLRVLSPKQENTDQKKLLIWTLFMQCKCMNSNSFCQNFPTRSIWKPEKRSWENMLTSSVIKGWNNILPRLLSRLSLTLHLQFIVVSDRQLHIQS